MSNGRANDSHPRHVPPVTLQDLRVLISYHYFKGRKSLDEMFDEYLGDFRPQVFADSGAYSALSLGVPVDLQDYIAWLKRYGHLFSHYANLDVIGDAQATLLNQRIMEDAGLTPVPVFHSGEDWSYLEYYLERYSYIALGGVASYRAGAKLMMPWLIQAFRMAGSTAVYHGFGITAVEVIRALPWRSVDSTTWAASVIFGMVPVYNTYKHSIVIGRLGVESDWRKYANLVRQLGFDWQDFAYRSRNTREKVCQLAGISYLALGQAIRRRHPDFELFLADTHLKDFAKIKAYLETAVHDPDPMTTGGTP